MILKNLVFDCGQSNPYLVQPFYFYYPFGINKSLYESYHRNTLNTLKPDFNWASTDISEIKNFYKLDKYILLFPFCSPHLMIKKWPHYNKLIEKISNKYGDEYKIITAPGPTEINDAKSINLS